MVPIGPLAPWNKLNTGPKNQTLIMYFHVLLCSPKKMQAGSVFQQSFMNLWGERSSQHRFLWTCSELQPTCQIFLSPFSLMVFKCSILVPLEEQYNSELQSFTISTFCATVLLFALHILSNIWCVTSFPSCLAQYNPHSSTLKDLVDHIHIMTPLPTLQLSPWELWKNDSTPRTFLFK